MWRTIGNAGYLYARMEGGRFTACPSPSSGPGSSGAASARSRSSTLLAEEPEPDVGRLSRREARARGAPARRDVRPRCAAAGRARDGDAGGGRGGRARRRRARLAPGQRDEERVVAGGPLGREGGRNDPGPLVFGISGAFCRGSRLLAGSRRVAGERRAAVAVRGAESAGLAAAAADLSRNGPRQPALRVRAVGPEARYRGAGPALSAGVARRRTVDRVTELTGRTGLARGARGAGARPVAAEPAAAVTGGVAGGVRNGAAVRRALAVGVEARSSRGALAAHGRRDAVALPGGELRALRSGRSRGRAGPTAASRRRRVVVTELDGRGGSRGSGGRGRGAGGRLLRRG